jgi:hypothetical protein
MIENCAYFKKRRE